MSLPLFLRGFVAVMLSAVCSLATNAQNPTVSDREDISSYLFHSSNNQVSFTVKEALLRERFLCPVCPSQEEGVQTRLEVFSARQGKVFDTRAKWVQPLVWNLKDNAGRPVSDEQLLCVLQVTLNHTSYESTYFTFGKLTRAGEQFVFHSPQTREGNFGGIDPVEFFKGQTLKAPADARAQLFYGISIVDGFGGGHVSNLVPQRKSSTPVGENATPPKLTDAELKNVKEQERKYRKSQTEFLTKACPVLFKAADLASDCETKLAALEYINNSSSSFSDESNVDEYRFLFEQVTLNKVKSGCQSSEESSQSYETLANAFLTDATERILACAVRLSEQGRAPLNPQKSYDLFQLCQAKPAERKRVENFLDKALRYADKSAEMNAGNATAYFVKGQVYEWKQRIAVNISERKKLGALAAEFLEKGMKPPQ